MWLLSLQFRFGGSCGLKKFRYGSLLILRIANQKQEKTLKKAGGPAVKARKAAERKPTMISVDGDTEIPPKANGGYEWSCVGKWKVVRLPGRSVWKRIQGRPGLNNLTKPARDALMRSLRLSMTEQ
jgi:hypothetical protein